MSPNNNFELLVDKIDGVQSAEDNAMMESLLAGDRSAAADLAKLQFIISGVREAGLYEQVSAIRNNFQLGVVATEQPAKVIRPNFRSTALRVAAAVILIVFSATTYKFVTVTDTNVYNKYYSSFDLGTSRDRAKVDQIDVAYKNKQWKQVVQLAEGAAGSNKEIFLKGMAQMELAQPGLAIISFKQISSQAGKNTEVLFLDQAQYYLAMAYLASNQSGLALEMLNRIKADADHLYNSRVKKMNLDLKVLEIKN